MTAAFFKKKTKKNKVYANESGYFPAFHDENKNCYSTDEAATLEPKTDQAE